MICLILPNIHYFQRYIRKNIEKKKNLNIEEGNGFRITIFEVLLLDTEPILTHYYAVSSV